MRRNMLCAMATLCAALMALPTARAQSLDGPLRIVVGYAPGGAADRGARLLADGLKDKLGVPVLVENKTGAGGRLSAQLVKATPPDQNVLLMGNPAIAVVAPLVASNVGYDPRKDFVPLSQIARYDFGIAVGPAVPVRELTHLLAWLREPFLGGETSGAEQKPAICRHGDGRITKGKITMIFHFEGMKRIEVQEAHAGDIVGLTGFEDVFIGETICDSEARPAIPYIPIDPPTIQMEFAVNDGPLAGQDGKLVTARHIWDRLVKEIRTNVALRIAQTSDPKIFAVSGRGEMQIAILVEQMRREGHEVLVSRPEVLWKKGPDDTSLEPIEKLYVEIPNENLGAIMETLSTRKAQITNMNHVANTVSVEALVPMRGLIGFETDLVNMTKGMGVMSHLFHEYGEDRGEIPARKNGSLVSMDNGEATPYALNMVQERGKLMVEPGDAIYVGMIVGENARDTDLMVNPVREKKLNNMRSGGDGKGIQLAPPMKLSLERALEYIDVDEYVEATPKNLRLRKKVLDENARKRSEKARSIKFIEA